MIYKDMGCYLASDKIFSNDMLFDYIEKRIYEEELDEYVNEILFDSESENYYISEKKVLCINPYEILCDAKNNNKPDSMNLISKYERDNCLVFSYNNVNVFNLFAINHEINHIIQNKIEEETNDFSFKKLLLLKDLITSNMDITYYNEKYYKKYNDYFFHEYNANIDAYLETVHLLNSYKVDNINDILIRFNQIIASHILYCYSDICNKEKTSTPIYNLLKLYNHLLNKINDEEINTCDLSLYKDCDIPKENLERLRLGLPISKKSLKYLEDVSNYNVKTLNLFDNIKR